MTSLATLEDVEAVLGRDIAGSELLRIERLLEMASRKVRVYTGQTFDVVENDVVALQTDFAGGVRLPQRPVTAVSSVVVLGETVDPDTYEWTSQGTLVRTYGFWSSTVTVTYSHGYETIPADVAQVVAELAAAKLTAPEGNVRSESIGSYSVSYGDSPATELTDDQRKLLDQYRNPGRPIPTLRTRRSTLDGTWL